MREKAKERERVGVRGGRGGQAERDELLFHTLYTSLRRTTIKGTYLLTISIPTVLYHTHVS